MGSIPIHGAKGLLVIEGNTILLQSIEERAVLSGSTMNKCPKCKTSSKYIYIGFNEVECVNEQCELFSAKAKEDMDKANTYIPKPDELDDEETKNMNMWISYAKLIRP